MATVRLVEGDPGQPRVRRDLWRLLDDFERRGIDTSQPFTLEVDRIAKLVTAKQEVVT